MFRYVLQIQILSIVVNKVSKMDYVFLFFKGGRKFSKNQSEVSDIDIRNLPSDCEGLTLEPSALKNLSGGQFTLSTLLIKADLSYCTSPTKQHHIFFRNL